MKKTYIAPDTIWYLVNFEVMLVSSAYGDTDKDSMDKEDDEEYQVGDPVGAQSVKGLWTEDGCQYGAQHGKEEHDAEAEHPCLATVLMLVVAVVHEEVNRHRYHREYAGCEHGEYAAADGQQEYHQQALVLLCRSGLLGLVRFPG